MSIRPTEDCLEFSLAGRSLKDMDVLSKSDPFVVFYYRDSPGNIIRVGQTETVWDNLDPNFVTKIYIPVSIVQQCINSTGAFIVTLEYYDQDREGLHKLHKQKFIGKVDIIFQDDILHTLDAEGKSIIAIRLLESLKGKVSHKLGMACLSVERINMYQTNVNCPVHIQMRFAPECEFPNAASNKASRKMFYVLNRKLPNPILYEDLKDSYPNYDLPPSWKTKFVPLHYTPVYRSGVVSPPKIAGDLFEFQPTEVPKEVIFGHPDENRSIRVEFFMYRDNGNHILLMYADFKRNELKKVNGHETLITDGAVYLEQLGLESSGISVKSGQLAVISHLPSTEIKALQQQLIFVVRFLSWEGRLKDKSSLMRIFPKTF